MKKVIIVALIFSSFNVFALKATDAIKYRQSAFQLIRANLTDMGDMIKGKKTYNAREFNKRAINLRALSTMPWEFFIADSVDIGDTKAKEDIWQDPQGFAKEYKNFQKLVSTLDKVAKPTSSLDDIKVAFSDVAKTCKNCHKKFRYR